MLDKILYVVDNNDIPHPVILVICAMMVLDVSIGWVGPTWL
jgi:hypothetical protein